MTNHYDQAPNNEPSSGDNVPGHPQREIPTEPQIQTGSENPHPGDTGSATDRPSLEEVIRQYEQLSGGDGQKHGQKKHGPDDPNDDGFEIWEPPHTLFPS